MIYRTRPRSDIKRLIVCAYGGSDSPCGGFRSPVAENVEGSLVAGDGRLGEPFEIVILVPFDRAKEREMGYDLIESVVVHQDAVAFLVDLPTDQRAALKSTTSIAFCVLFLRLG